MRESKPFIWQMNLLTCLALSIPAIISHIKGLEKGFSGLYWPYIFYALATVQLVYWLRWAVVVKQIQKAGKDPYAVYPKRPCLASRSLAASAFLYWLSTLLYWPLLKAWTQSEAWLKQVSGRPRFAHLAPWIIAVALLAIGLFTQLLLIGLDRRFRRGTSDESNRV